MGRLLIQAGLWLNKRFPERVIVTQADYDALNAKLDASGAIMERVAKLEMTVNAHSQMMGIGMSGKLGGNMTGSLER